jgi:hypothetical protein
VEKPITRGATPAEPAWRPWGVLDQPNEEEQRLFETVVQRNAINYHCPRQAAGVVLAADSPERLRAAAAGLLDRVLGRGDRR